jgi:hypothetical protein
MPTATLYNLPPKLVGYASSLVGVPLVLGTTATGRGVKATAHAATLHHARLMVELWANGQLLCSGFTTAHVSASHYEAGGVTLAE